MSIMSHWRVVINEQHELLPNQHFVLNAVLGARNWSEFRVPTQGWTLAEMRQIAASWPRGVGAVFASPVPALIVLLAKHRTVKVLHNDRREAVETKRPDGTVAVTHRVAQDGWEIV